MVLHVQEKEIVAPGEVIATGMDYLPSNGTYREAERIRANRLGLLSIEGKVIKTIPLSGVYIPKKNDVIIGQVIDILMTGWRMHLNSPYSGVLGLKDATFDFVSKGADLTKYFDLDDYVVTKIIQVTTQNLVDLTCKGPGLKKLVGGRIIKVSPQKVPRIIGSQGSMVTMISKATDCKIVVGQNGLVWINGAPEKEAVAFRIIKEVEEQAHLPGLTDKIKGRLNTILGIDVDSIPNPVEKEDEYVQRPQRDYSREGGDRPPFRPRRPMGPRTTQRPSFENREQRQ